MLHFTHVASLVVHFAVNILHYRKELISCEGISIKYYEFASVFLS